MNSTTLPSGHLRLATIRDVPRLSQVATAGFFYSPAFTWERRYHHQYPEDTRKAYEKILSDSIRDPKVILVVVEDSYQPDENTKTGATIVSNSEENNPQTGDLVAVGFAVWSLPSGSKYIGKFMDDEDLASDKKPAFDGGLDRDRDVSLVAPLYEADSAAKEKNFQGRIIINLITIHPAYWRRGHGKALLNWGLALAREDGLKTGVCANTRAVGLYLSMGFVEVDRISAKDNEEPPILVEGVYLAHD
ncbi:hypothetical protein N431DRAFT_417442 [Stipitochalara longipes BDJ]|nr:hypothetical protein N431DRAFT_417442 [Stipitochalara longipes BDJ]